MASSSNTHLDLFVAACLFSFWVVFWNRKYRLLCRFAIVLNEFSFKLPWWKTLITFISFANHSYCVAVVAEPYESRFSFVPFKDCLCLSLSLCFCFGLRLWLCVYMDGMNDTRVLNAYLLISLYIVHQPTEFTYATCYFAIIFLIVNIKQWQYFLFAFFLCLSVWLWTQQKIAVKRIDVKLKWI